MRASYQTIGVEEGFAWTCDAELALTAAQALSEGSRLAGGDRVGEGEADFVTCVTGDAATTALSKASVHRNILDVERLGSFFCRASRRRRPFNASMQDVLHLVKVDDYQIWSMLPSSPPTALMFAAISATGARGRIGRHDARASATIVSILSDCGRTRIEPKRGAAMDATATRVHHNCRSWIDMTLCALHNPNNLLAE
jgi:hypothetical protein